MDRRRPRKEQPQLTPAQDKYDRVMIVLIIALALAVAVGLYFLLTTPRVARAEGLAIEIGQDNQAARELSAPTAISVRWSKEQTPRAHHVVLCETRPDKFMQGWPFRVDCSQGAFGLAQPAGYPSGITYTSQRREPFWAFAVVVFENGQLILSDRVLVNTRVPAGIEPEPVIFEAFATSPKATAASVDSVGAHRWDLGDGPAATQFVYCRTDAEPGNPIKVDCSAMSGSEGKPTPRRGASWGAIPHASPQWYWVLAYLEDGRVIASNPALIDPVIFASDTDLAMWGQVQGEKETFAPGDVIVYNVFLRNEGQTFSKAPLVSIGTYWSQDTLEIVQRHGLSQFEDRDGAPGFEIYYAPEDLAPGQEQLIASTTFQVTKPGIVQLATRGSILGFGIQGSFELLRQAK